MAREWCSDPTAEPSGCRRPTARCLRMTAHCSGMFFTCFCGSPPYRRVPQESFKEGPTVMSSSLIASHKDALSVVASLSQISSAGNTSCRRAWASVRWGSKIPTSTSDASSFPAFRRTIIGQDNHLNTSALPFRHTLLLSEIFLHIKKKC